MLKYVWFFTMTLLPSEKAKLGTVGPGVRKGLRGLTRLWSTPGGGIAVSTKRAKHCYCWHLSSNHLRWLSKLYCKQTGWPRCFCSTLMWLWWDAQTGCLQGSRLRLFNVTKNAFKVWNISMNQYNWWEQDLFTKGITFIDIHTTFCWPFPAVHNNNSY